MEVQLSQEHIEAVDRQWRVVVNFDAIIGDAESFTTKEVAELVKWKFMYILTARSLRFITSPAVMGWPMQPLPSSDCMATYNRRFNIVQKSVLNQ